MQKKINLILFSILGLYLLVFLIISRLFLSEIIFKTDAVYNVFLIVFYFFLLLSGIIFILYNLKNNNWKKYLSFILFSAVFSYSLIWIKQGLDLTDEGFTISKAYFMFNGLWNENVDFIWGTSFINGLWLTLAGKPFIIWERVGYSLLISSMALLSFKMLSFYFDEVMSVCVVFISMIFVRMNIQTINYNVLPGFLILASVFMLFRSIENRSSERLNARLFLFFSGVLIGLSIHTRFTYLSYLFINFVFFLIYFFVKKEKKIINEYFINFSGIIFGISIGLLILFFNNSLSDYINNIKYMFFDVLVKGQNQVGNSVTTETHSFALLLGDYIKNFKMIAFYYLLFILFPVIIIFVKKAFNREFINKILNLLLFLSILGVYVFLFRKYYDKRIFISVILFNLTFVFFNEINFKKYYFLIFWAMFMPIFNALGSDIFFDNFFTSGGIIFLLSISLIGMGKTFIKQNHEVVSFKSITIILICFLFITGAFRQLKYVYRDVLFLNKNNALFESRNLAGIRTSEKRKVAIEGLINFFKGDESFKDKKILVLNSQPMIYAVLGHKYYFQTNWAPWIFLDDADFLAYKLDEYKKNKNLPDYIIFPPKNSRLDLWPDVLENTRASDAKAYALFKDFSHSDSFEQVFNNNGYEVYKLKK